jgi:hypothetical protein
MQRIDANGAPRWTPDVGPGAGCSLWRPSPTCPRSGRTWPKLPIWGEEFVVLTAACPLLTVAAISCDSTVLYCLSILTCGLAVIGYGATRLIAFPQLADDVGHWFEPLGMVSVVAESVAVVAGINGLRRHRTTVSDAVGFE